MLWLEVTLHGSYGDWSRRIQDSVMFSYLKFFTRHSALENETNTLSVNVENKSPSDFLSKKKKKDLNCIATKVSKLAVCLPPSLHLNKICTNYSYVA
jgi:hypothetical protein